MNIVWQDSVGSFLDPSIIDAASYSTLSPAGDGGALWSSAPDGGSSAAGASLLWDDGAGTSSSWQALLVADGMSSAGWQHDFGVSRGSLDVAWPDGIGAGTGLLWQPNGSQTQEPFAATPLAGSAQWTSSLSTPADILWSGSEPSSLPALLGLSQPALNMLAGVGPQPLGGSPFSLDPALLPGLGSAPQSLASLPASQLLWDGSGSTNPMLGQGILPSGSQQSPMLGMGPSASALQLFPGVPASGIVGAHN
jgi:hypothetical protein